MLSDLDAGDVALTIFKFFEESKTVKPAARSLLSLQEIDEFLQTLSTLSKEDEQQKLLTEICKKWVIFNLLIVPFLIPIVFTFLFSFKVYG